MTDGSYSVERLLDAFDKVPALVAVVRGPEHRYVFMNDAYRAVVGIGQAIGEPFGKSPHDSSGAFRRLLGRVYETGQTWAAQEVPVATFGGEQKTRYFNMQFIPLRSAGGSTDGVLIHSFEVTELVLARLAVAEGEAQILHVQKLESLGVLAGGIAHDFNNMLTAVQGSIAMGTLMLSAEHPVQKVFRDALAAVQRAADLTRQLLAYSGKGSFRIERMDLSAHVAEVTHLLEAALPKKVQLRLELDRDLPPVEVDPSQLQQITMNLVINGAEAIGEERGTVRVTTGVQDVDAAYASGLLARNDLPLGRCVYLEVQDTGCGMDAETRAKIFDPFFTTKFTGRGLGLAAVLGIVKTHKAGIEVRSARGAGTTFRVYFAPASGKAPRPERSPEASLHGHGLVLVIDDDRGVRMVVKDLLAYFGFDVIGAPDGRDGVEAFAARAAEVRFVVLDMTMPELSGEETLRELRAIRPDVPVILSSGYDEAEATRRLSGTEYTAFLPKPFTPDDLDRCIRAAEAALPPQG